MNFYYVCLIFYYYLSYGLRFLRQFAFYHEQVLVTDRERVECL